MQFRKVSWNDGQKELSMNENNIPFDRKNRTWEEGKMRLRLRLRLRMRALAYLLFKS
jgi:hypothetical protein